MSSDIYVMWGSIKNQEAWQRGDIHDAIQFPKDRYHDQKLALTEYPEAGYLREMAGVIPYIEEVSTIFHGPNPYFFLKLFGWIQPNSFIYLDETKINTLLEFRDEKLRPWIRLSTKYREQIGENDTKREDFFMYYDKIRLMISFINYIELHQYEENLVIFVNQ